jgi:hypothetical protein
MVATLSPSMTGAVDGAALCGLGATLMRTPSFLPSLRFHPILVYVRTLYINKINEPNEYCQVRKSLVPGNGAPLHRVAPLQSLIRAPYQQTCCCCVACTQRSHPSAPLALVCFVVFLVRNLYFPPAQVICWNSALRKSGPHG